MITDIKLIKNIRFTINYINYFNQFKYYFKFL